MTRLTRHDSHQLASSLGAAARAATSRPRRALAPRALELPRAGLPLAANAACAASAIASSSGAASSKDEPDATACRSCLICFLAVTNAMALFRALQGGWGECGVCGGDQVVVCSAAAAAAALTAFPFRLLSTATTSAAASTLRT